METKNCKRCKADFVLDADDLGFYKKMKVPAPNICPDCRFKMRAVFRNERTLYNQKCRLCDRSVITMYHPKSPYVVYCNDCYLSDKWDPYSYAVDYDPKQPFFKQLRELVEKVPKSATYSSVSTGTNINSEYANFAGGNKDGYLIFNCGPNNENIAYSRGLIDSKDTYDCYYGDELENSYEGVNVHKSNGVIWAQNISDTIDSRFVLNCPGGQNYFSCVNLPHKSYYFFNKPLSREAWLSKVSEISGSYSRTEEMKKKFDEFSLQFPRRQNNNLKVVNCTGDYIFESKNCHDCFELSFCEDMRHCFSVKKAKGCMDMIGHCRRSELLYNGVGVGANSQNVICSWWVESSREVEYSFATRRSANCFGTDGVTGGNFVILNKKYTKEEYIEIKEQIIHELKSTSIYGDFFPSEMAFFAYNETIANDNMPMSKEEVLAQGFRWEDDIQKTEGKGTIKPEDIPDHIDDVKDGILKDILTCTNCSRNYILIERELALYRKLSIPVPRVCWGCRFIDRIRRRGPYKFWARHCAKCKKEITTNYAPDRPEIVYCEKCYQQEVY